MFEVVVFLACRNATPEGPRGPGAMMRLPYTLEGVSYTFAIDNPAAEPPFAVGDVWLYLRFHRTTLAGFTRRFAVRILEVGDGDSRTRVPYPANPPTSEPFALSEIQFPSHSPATSVAVVLRDVEVPRRGRYEFRLLVERKKPTWKGSNWLWVASHFIAIE